MTIERTAQISETQTFMENESVSEGEQGAKSKPEKEEENKKELALRTEQLDLVRAAIEKLDKAADEARKKNKRHKALLSHLRTFYSEMNNIAKGKAMSLIPVAELMVTQIPRARCSITHRTSFRNASPTLLFACFRPLFFTGSQPRVLLRFGSLSARGKNTCPHFAFTQDRSPVRPVAD